MGGFTPRMTRQGLFKASTHGGYDVSLLAQQLDRRLTLTDSLQISTRVRLAIIPFAYEALRDLCTFAFVALHLFSASERHSSAIVNILHLLESLEKLQTKVHRMISFPHLFTTIIYNVSQRWS